MKVPKLNGQARIIETDSVAKGIYAGFQTSSLTEDQHLSKMMSELNGLSLRMTGAIGAVETESSLDEKDGERDGDTRDLFNFVKGQCSHPSKEIKESALVVWDTLDSFGIGIVSERYTIQTSLAKALLEKLADPSITAHIAKVPGVDTLIEKVKTSNDSFEVASLAYEHTKAHSTIKDSATDIKKEIIPLINNRVVVYLRAMATVDEPNFGEFTRVTAQLIDNTNKAIKNR